MCAYLPPFCGMKSPALIRKVQIGHAAPAPYLTCKWKPVVHVTSTAVIQMCCQARLPRRHNSLCHMLHTHDEKPRENGDELSCQASCSCKIRCHTVHTRHAHIHTHTLYTCMGSAMILQVMPMYTENAMMICLPTRLPANTTKHGLVVRVGGLIGTRAVLSAAPKTKALSMTIKAAAHHTRSQKGQMCLRYHASHTQSPQMT